MTTAKRSVSPIPFMTGFCGYSGLHSRCPVVLTGRDCTCECHYPQPAPLALVVAGAEEAADVPAVEQPGDVSGSPTPDLGDTLTTLAAAVHDLGQALMGFDGNAVEWCDLLGRVRAVRQELAQLESLIERDTARAMPRDLLEWDGGTAERRGGKDRKEWDHDALSRAVTAAIVPALAVDPSSGEVDRDLAATLHEAITQYAATNRPSWRTTALRPLGIDPDEFCTAVPGRSTVQVTLAGGAA